MMVAAPLAKPLGGSFRRLRLLKDAIGSKVVESASLPHHSRRRPWR
jgi:hypothetical protein